MTFASTVNQVVLSGAKPVFVDIDYDTLLVKPDHIAKAITKKTKAVIPVHFAGAPADMDAVVAACGKIPVIEDAAHAIGTFYKGSHIGARNIAVFSFHPIKNITCAEGGMVTGGSKDLMDKLKLLKFHGIERDAWKRYGKASAPTYEIEEPGFKYNLTDLQAALGIVQLKKLNEINARRTLIAQHYITALPRSKASTCRACLPITMSIPGTSLWSKPDPLTEKYSWPSLQSAISATAFTSRHATP